MSDLDPVVDHEAIVHRVKRRFEAAVIHVVTGDMAVNNDAFTPGLYSLIKSTGSFVYYPYAPVDGHDNPFYVLGAVAPDPLPGDLRSWPNVPLATLTELHELANQINEEEGFDDVHSIRVLIQGGGDSRVTMVSAHFEYLAPTGEEELVAGIQ